MKLLDLCTHFFSGVARNQLKANKCHLKSYFNSTSTTDHVLYVSKISGLLNKNSFLFEPTHEPFHIYKYKKVVIFDLNFFFFEFILVYQLLLPRGLPISTYLLVEPSHHHRSLAYPVQTVSFSCAFIVCTRAPRLIPFIPQIVENRRIVTLLCDGAGVGQAVAVVLHPPIYKPLLLPLLVVVSTILTSTARRPSHTHFYTTHVCVCV